MWYQYAAPATGTGSATFTISNTSDLPLLSTYTGTSLGALTKNVVNSIHGSGSFGTTPGTTYYVEVAINGTAPASAFTLNWTWVSGPANDYFSSPQAISGASGSVSGTTVGSTVESLEPYSTSYAGTVWYQYTAPSGSAGFVSFSTNASYQIPTGYTGTSFGTLGGYFGNQFATTPGTIYLLQVGALGTTAPFTLSWTWNAAPANDNFASATAISGASGTVSGTTIGSTVETGDPASSVGSRQSVWYAYTPPSAVAGTVSMGLTNTSAAQDLGIFTGPNLAGLTKVAGGAASESFATVPGKTDYIEVYAGITASAFSLNWTWAPSNDVFANAQPISGAIGSTAGTTKGATLETGEPNSGSTSNTVWYAYVPASSGELSVSVGNDSPAQNVAVYTGNSVSTLTAVPGTGGTFPVVAGTTYFIQVVSSGTSTANFTLNWSLLASAGNDLFANAQAISGVSGTTTGTTAGATTESGEPGTGASTVWYAYTVPSAAAGTATLNLSGQTASQTVSAYTGTALANLVQVASGTNSVTFSTSGATTYYVQVSGAAGATSAFTLNWTWAPVNDLFANAISLTGLSGSANGTTTGATVETGEPNAGTAGNTVWYAYAATSSGQLSLALGNDSPAQTLAVYTGNTASTLTPVAGAGGVFNVAAGTTYFIQVSSSGSATADFSLTWSFATGPANDNFANAQSISGASGSLSGTTAASTQETGEPNTVTGDGSVWYAYTAPSSAPGSVTFTQASGPTLTYHVYTGTALTNLTATPLGTNTFFFGTSIGQTYYLQIQGPVSGNETFTYNWNWTAQTLLANDDFANATPMTGSGAQLAEPLAPSTLEVGEPNASGLNGSVWAAVTEGAGTATITDNEPDNSRCINVYTGTALNNLTLIESQGDGATFTTVPGTTYYVQIGDTGSDTSGFVVTLSWIPSPPINDNFANATGLSGTTGSLAGTTLYSTLETNEPNTVAGEGSVWYSYAAPSAAAGTAALSLSGETAGQTVTVYTGTALANLVRVATGTNSASFSTAGTTTAFYIQVTGGAAATSAFTLNWSWSPVNDLFATAISLTGAAGTVNGTTTGASVETGEPNSGSTSNSVWYAYTPGAIGQLALSIGNDAPAQGVAVYTGNTVSTLTPVPNTAGIFTTAAGTTYFIQVASPGTAASDFTLNWSWLVTPGNDNFANAQTIAGAGGTVSGTTVGSTVENGEPGGAAGTVWYAYTAPSAAAGSATVSVSGSSAQVATIYTGTALTNLVQVATGTGSLQFATSGAVTYYVQVSASAGGTSAFTLTWVWAPVNDLFANATSLTGAFGTANGTTTGGTVEAGEPNSGTTGNSVWYAYLAQGTGQASFTLSNDAPAQNVAVYTGNSVSNLTAAPGSAGAVTTAAGTTYFIQISSSGTSTADFTLNWSFVATGTNDNFAGAQAISGLTGSVSGTTVGSTLEANEPNTVSGDGSVWYAYTAPSSAPGSVTFTEASGPALTYHVYTGTSLTNLTATSVANSTFYFGTSLGQTYYLQIQGPTTGSPGFTYNWTWTTQNVVSNDDFANAMPVTGNTSGEAGQIAGSTLEVGEPNPSGLNGSVWWAVTEPTGWASIADDAPDSNRCINVYTGTALTNLVRVAGGGDSAYFATVVGTTYYVQIGDTGTDTYGINLLFTWSASAAPANDNFANAQVISGLSGSVNGTTNGASLESGDPDAASLPGADATVWYQYTAPSGGSGPIVFTGNCNVYTGSALGNLALVAIGNSNPGASFTPVPGTTYYIEFASIGGTSSNFTLSWYFAGTGAPVNDNFMSATILTGTTGSVSGATVNSTHETNEPNPVSGDGSVWYKYEAPTNAAGSVTFTEASGPALTYNVYSGTSLTNLTAVQLGSSSLFFATSASLTYYIQIQGPTTGTGFTYIWTWTTQTIIPNDDFANATPLTGNGVQASGPLAQSTLQAGEDNANLLNGSVWLAVTEPTGWASIADNNPDSNRYITVYTGNSIGSLTRVASSGDSASFPTVAGTTYYVQVGDSGTDTSSYNLTLSWSASTAPANDNISNSQTISGPGGSVNGTTVGASVDTGDPAAGAGVQATVWYQYTVPSGSSGTLDVSLASQNPQTFTVYTGTSFANFTAVATGNATSSASFTPVPGTTYYIEVVDSDVNWCNFTLTWSLSGNNPPSNDNFANATPISGASGAANSTTLGATMETGEPGTGTSNHSVWFSYTAPSTNNGQLTLSLSAESPAQNLAIYTGTSVSSLTALALSNGYYPVNAGAQYAIQVSSSGDSTSDFALNWSWTGNPSNDNFANATFMGLGGSITGSTLGATIESGDPVAGTGSQESVWYLLFAPAAGYANLTLTSTAAAQNMTVYTGSALGSLTQVTSGGNAVGFGTSPGARFYLEVYSSGNNPSPFTLTTSWGFAPANDNFSSATAISGSTGSTSGTTQSATIETGDPVSTSVSSHSVWYAYTSPSSGAGKLTLALTAGVSQNINVYSGTALANLVTVGSGANSAAVVVQPSTTYHIEIYSTGNNPSSFTLGWTWAATPANDNFANAQAISGASGSVSGTTVGSTVESGEPGGASGTVWYAYTAPSAAAGSATVSVGNGSNSQVATIYTGTALGNLVQLASGTSSVQFATSGAVTYYVQVPISGGAASAFNLSWTWAPVNDLFANASAISGASGSVNGTTKAASVETGEPGTGSTSDTVWYVYTAPSGSAGQLSLGLGNDSPAQTLAVYTGTSVSALTEDTAVSGNFVTAPSGTYYIQVASSGSSVADFTLSWSWVSTPSNDNFSGAITLSANGSATGTSVGASIQANDPVSSSGSDQSVWYVFPPEGPRGGSANLTLSNTTSAQNINVYSGTVITALTQVATGSNALEFSTKLATPYYVEIYSSGNDPSAFTLTTTWVGAQVNDNFASATAISGTSSSVGGSTKGATVEAGDPAVSTGTDHTVWFAYTASTTSAGFVTPRLLGTPAQFMAVYTGTALANLEKIAAGAPTTTFAVTAGGLYYIEVYSSGDNPGTFTLAWSWTAQPSNDNFSGSSAIAGASGSIQGTTVGATVESGDPAAGSGTTQTVWYAYTAPSSAAGAVNLTLSNSPNQTIYVYTGTALANLVQVGSATNTLTFEATAGTLYFVEIASQSGEPAGFTLSWTWSQAGANDNFANAQAISGVYGSINGTTVNASVEPGDPAAGTGTDQTVWYSYVAPTTGVQISLYDESQAQNVYFYTGTTLANLVNITSTVNPNTGVLPTTPGATYYVEVASQGNNPGTFGLLWQAVPANDNFANAQGITGTYGSVNGSDSPATTEAGEPGVSNYAQSVWYSYTAPNGAPGYLFFNLSNQFGNVINIYTGNSLSNLQLVGSNTYGVAFNATAGTTYQIQILSNSELDSFTLNWLFEPAPANDNFANAQAISGYNGTAAGSLSAATIESGEPSVTTGSASIWYEYTAPADCAGQVSFTETDMDGGVDIYVYSGSSLTNLTRLTSQDLEHPAVLATTPGATYYVQIFSAGSDQFISTSLAWSWISNNDNFASATALPSANGSMTGTTFGATVQSGEPNSSSTNQSVWYAYTAPSPSAGTATFSLTGNSTAQNVDVYTGSALGSLTLVGSGSNGATMSTTPGTTYYIQVESPADNPASFTFNWSWTASGGTSSFNRSSSANLNALPVARKSSAHSS